MHFQQYPRIVLHFSRCIDAYRDHVLAGLRDLGCSDVPTFRQHAVRASSSTIGRPLPAGPRLET